MPMNRRTFLTTTAAAAGCALAPWAARGESRARELAANAGLQLYTVRELLAENPAETFDNLAENGYTSAEHFDLGTLAKVHEEGKRTGIRILGTHVPSGLFTGRWDLRGGEPPNATVDAAVEAAQQHGLEFLILAWLFPEERGGLDVYKKLAASLNAAGEKCRAAGLKMGYHHHNFEFEPVDGTTPFDVLAQELDGVQLEVDVFWATVAGHDPAALIEKLGERCKWLHLKDLKDGTERSPTANPPPQAFQQVGAGVIDFPAVLRAAAAAGVEHCFVEQDQTVEHPFIATRKSLRYLRGLSL